MKRHILKSLFCLLILIIACRANGAGAFFLGQSQDFFVDPSYDSSGRSTFSAFLKIATDRSLIYVENDWWSSLENRDQINSYIKNLGDEFDKTIYPRLTQIYGSEWSPGIDNEYRIIILITRMKEGTAGYFNSADEYPKSQSQTSNEREMIYLNGTYLSSDRTKGFLAHEFQHMITFYQKEKVKNLVEDVWLNEARSEYASTLCGYDNIYKGSNLEKRVNEFLQNPSDSLTEWENKSSDYSSVNLFMQYLVGRYSAGILTRMIKADTVGIASINKALEEIGSAERFFDVFTNWTIASYVNNCQVGDGQRYCYLSSNLPYDVFHLGPGISNSLSAQDGTVFSFSDNTKDWAGHWYEILSQGGDLNLALNFYGVNAKWQIPIIIYNVDGSKDVRFLATGKDPVSDFISDFGRKVNGIIIIPLRQAKLENFSASEPFYPFSFEAKLTSLSQISSSSSFIEQNSSPSSSLKPNYPDGSLIRATGDSRVFVINGKYKRWIQSPAILAAYPHFSWQNIIQVSSAERDWYQEAWLVRANGDYKVYEINGDGTKHWLDMSSQQFSQSGRSWDMVFVINKIERDLYRTGAAVTR